MRLNPQLLVSIFCAGLAGSIFTWYVNRPNPTVITYSVTTTSLETNQTIKGLIPNLKIRIGDEEVPVIHMHTLEIAAQQGQFLDKADIAITFPSPVRFFGRILAEAPSSLQHIECTQLSIGANCNLFPVAPGKGSFRITMATDQKPPPTALMVARNAELLSADLFLKEQHRVLGIGMFVWVALAISLGSSIFIGMFITWWLNRQTTDRKLSKL